jgi:hypothetical protein
LWRFSVFGDAVEGDMLALANGALANADLQAITLAGEITLFEEQAIGGFPRG